MQGSQLSCIGSETQDETLITFDISHIKKMMTPILQYQHNTLLFRKLAMLPPI